MSFTKDSVTYYEPTDLTELTLAAVQGVIGYAGDQEYRVTKGSIPSLTHTHDKISHAIGSHITCYPTGVISIVADDKMNLYAGNHWYMYMKGALRIVSYGHLNITDFTGQIRCVPSGSNSNVYADAFVEWSSARNKTDVIDLPPVVLPPPKKYKVNGKDKYGFIAEDMPVPLRVSTILGDSSEEIGIDVMGVIAAQERRINDLELRISQLEKKVK